MGSNATPDAHSDEEAPLYAMQLALSAALPMTLRAAIELGLLETISAAGPGAQLSAAELASRLPATLDAHYQAKLDRILRFLASYSILTCSLSPSGECRYGAAPVCKLLSRNANGESFAEYALAINGKVFLNSWFHLKDAVMEGEIPFKKANGMPVFEYLGTDPILNRDFNVGLAAYSAIISDKLLEKYEGFEGLGLLVDVGGGSGITLGKITAKHPGIRGINFDLPHVISSASPLPGVEHVAGDMFESVPTADAIFMKWILHDWSDEHCLKLLKNCWKALPVNGKVIVVEFILPEKPEASSSAAKAVMLMDICMLAYTFGGKERTEKEYESLAMETGFSGFKSINIYSEFWVMEFTKKTEY